MPPKTISTGIDIVHIERFLPSSREGRLVRRLFTPSEIEYCFRKRHPHIHLAARFAAKEAFIKAVNTGLSGKMSWKDIEVVDIADGAPVFRFSLRLKRRLKGARPLLSISCSRGLAAALVVMER